MIIPFKAPPPPKPVVRVCSFCTRPEAKVKKMIAGPDGHNICDDCVAHATQRMEDAAQ